MKTSLYLVAGALLATLTFAGAASASPALQSGVTQDLSARCRVVVTHAWRHGHRVTVKRTVCDHRRHNNW